MQLNNIKTKEADLTKALGITIGRAKELGKSIGAILDKCSEEKLNLPESLARLAEVCENANELTLVMFTMGEEMAEHRIMSSAIHVGVDELSDFIKTSKSDLNVN